MPKSQRASSRSSRWVVALVALPAAAGAGFFAADRLGWPTAEPTEEARAAAPKLPSAPAAASSAEKRVPESAAAPVAAAFAGTDWVAENNAARDLLEAGELLRAVEIFAACRAADPQNDVFRRNHAEALSRLATDLHGRGELADAVERLDAAVKAAPERTELAELLERWRRELELAAGDTFAPGSYFRIEHDGERRDLVRHGQEIIDYLEGGGRYSEGAYEALRGFFGIDPVLATGERIRVVLYDREEFDRLTGLGHWAGGVFDGVIRVALDDLADEGERSRWERVLRHELVHAFVRDIGGYSVPGWLNEGLAQLLEERSPSTARARAELVGKPLFTLEQLAAGLASWKDPTEISRAYAQSLVLVDMIRRDYGDEVLRRLLRGCKEGRPVEESFREASGGVALSTVWLDLELALAPSSVDGE